MARSSNGLAVRSFSGKSGSTEHYITVETPNGLDLARQVDAVAQRYAEALQELRLSPETAVFRRIFVSDSANQAEFLRQSSLFQEPLDSRSRCHSCSSHPCLGARSRCWPIT